MAVSIASSTTPITTNVLNLRYVLEEPFSSKKHHQRHTPMKINTPQNPLFFKNKRFINGNHHHRNTPSHIPLTKHRSSSDELPDYVNEPSYASSIDNFRNTDDLEDYTDNNEVSKLTNAGQKVTEVEPWIIKLRDHFFGTSVSDRNDVNKQRSVLVLFDNQDKCVEFKNKLIDYYRKSGGNWCNTCISYNINRSHVHMVLSTLRTASINDDEDNKNECDTHKLKCVPFNENEGQFAYTLSMITNFSCFVCQSFETNEEVMDAVLSGFFIELDEDILVRVNPNYRDRMPYIINYMNEMYRYDV